MILFRRSIVALAAVALAATGGLAPARAAGTVYFAVVAGSNIPVAISSFSSDARADVASYAYGAQSGSRAAHGKFSTASDGSPFDGARSIPQLIVVARTPEKTVTFTFTNVTIDDVSPSGSKNERVTFESENYDVKFTAQKTQ